MSKNERYDEVWCVVMFDLPVQTKSQRRETSKFRKLLLESGYSMIQYSVYGKYSPTLNSNLAIERFLERNLPSEGEVRIFHLSDNQWSKATRIVGKKHVKNEEKPQELTLFSF